jgi:hypothetical protein
MCDEYDPPPPYIDDRLKGEEKCLSSIEFIEYMRKSFSLAGSFDNQKCVLCRKENYKMCKGCVACCTCLACYMKYWKSALCCFTLMAGILQLGGLKKEHELFGTGMFVCSDECKLALTYHLESNNIRVIGYDQSN